MPPRCSSSGPIQAGWPMFFEHGGHESNGRGSTEFGFPRLKQPGPPGRDVKTNTTGSDPTHERIIVADYVLRELQSPADARRQYELGETGKLGTVTVFWLEK